MLFRKKLKLGLTLFVFIQGIIIISSSLYHSTRNHMIEKEVEHRIVIECSKQLIKSTLSRINKDEFFSQLVELTDDSEFNNMLLLLHRKGEKTTEFNRKKYKAVWMDDQAIMKSILHDLIFLENIKTVKKVSLVAPNGYCFMCFMKNENIFTICPEWLTITDDKQDANFLIEVAGTPYARINITFEKEETVDMILKNIGLPIKILFVIMIGTLFFVRVFLKNYDIRTEMVSECQINI